MLSSTDSFPSPILAPARANAAYSLRSLSASGGKRGLPGPLASFQNDADGLAARAPAKKSKPFLDLSDGSILNTPRWGDDVGGLLGRIAFDLSFIPDAYGYEMLDHDVGPRTDRAEISPLLSDPEAEPSEADYIAIGSSAPAAQPTLSAAAQEMLVTLEASGLTLDDLGGPQALETMVQQLQEDGPITLPPIVIVAVAQRAVSAYGLDYNERLRARLMQVMTTKHGAPSVEKPLSTKMFTQYDANERSHQALILETPIPDWHADLCETNFEFEGTAYSTRLLDDWVADISRIESLGFTYSLKLGPFPFMFTEADMARHRPQIIPHYGQAITYYKQLDNGYVQVGLAMKGADPPMVRKTFNIIRLVQSAGKMEVKFYGKLNPKYNQIIALGLPSCMFCPGMAGGHVAHICDGNQKNHSYKRAACKAFGLEKWVAEVRKREMEKPGSGAADARKPKPKPQPQPQPPAGSSNPEAKCKKFASKGKCRFGDSCKFGH